MDFHPKTLPRLDSILKEYNKLSEEWNENKTLLERLKKTGPDVSDVIDLKTLEEGFLVVAQKILVLQKMVVGSAWLQNIKIRSEDGSEFHGPDAPDMKREKVQAIESFPKLVVLEMN